MQFAFFILMASIYRKMDPLNIFKFLFAINAPLFDDAQVKKSETELYSTLLEVYTIYLNFLV